MGRDDHKNFINYTLLRTLKKLLRICLIILDAKLPLGKLIAYDDKVKRVAWRPWRIRWKFLTTCCSGVTSTLPTPLVTWSVT